MSARHDSLNASAAFSWKAILHAERAIDLTQCDMEHMGSPVNGYKRTTTRAARDRSDTVRHATYGLTRERIPSRWQRGRCLTNGSLGAKVGLIDYLNVPGVNSHLTWRGRSTRAIRSPSSRRATSRIVDRRPFTFALLAGKEQYSIVYSFMNHLSTLVAHRAYSYIELAHCFFCSKLITAAGFGHGRMR